MNLKKKRLEGILHESKVASTEFLAALQESNFDVRFGGEVLVKLIHDADEDNFQDNYIDALSAQVIVINDESMVSGLKRIAEDYTAEDIIKLMVTSCENAENFKTCGQFFNLYCCDMLAKDASRLIMKGMYVFMFCGLLGLTMLSHHCLLATYSFTCFLFMS